MTPKQMYNKALSDRIIKGLTLRNMAGYYCETKSDALEKALSLIPKGSTIAWGGSMSIDEIGLKEAIHSGDYTLYDRDLAKTPEETKAIFRQAFSADYYLASTNAITMNGELVNIDGNGNRVAAMIYGPDNVILIVGMNKVAKDEQSARERVREHASPLNAMRLGTNTPCKDTGVCHNCVNSTICCHIVTTRSSRVAGRIKVILVGEEIGY